MGITEERRKELKRKVAKWHLETLKHMQAIERAESREKFEKEFESSRQDPLALLVEWPVDTCEGAVSSYVHCYGWKKYMKTGDLLDEISDVVEEVLYEQYEDDFKVEKRMEKMTDKKAVRLLGNDWLDDEYPGCPYREFCPEHGE